MAELLKTIKVDAVGLDKVQTMIDLLDKYRDELPQELLKELADCEACEITMKSLQVAGFSPCKLSCFDGGEKLTHVVSVNKILKRVQRCRNIGRQELDYFYSYPETFKMTCSSKIICEW